AGLLATGVGTGYVNNFTLPGTESQRAADLLKNRFPQQSGDSSQIVFHAASGTLSDSAHRAQVQSVIDRVKRQPSVAGVVSPFATAGAVSKDGRTAYATLLFDKQAQDLDKGDVTRVIDTARAGGGAG